MDSLLGVLRTRATRADLLPASILSLLPAGPTRTLARTRGRLARVFQGVPYYLAPTPLGACGQDGISVISADGREGEATVALIDNGGWYGFFSGPSAPGPSLASQVTTSTTVEGVVPDNIASVTLRYPPGHTAGSPGSAAGGAFTVTTRPINNVALVAIPRRSARPAILGTPLITLRAASGRIVKTLRRP